MRMIASLVLLALASPTLAQTAAVIDKNNDVVNVIVADATSDPPPPGTQLVNVPADMPVDQNWGWDPQARQFLKPKGFAVVDQTNRVVDVVRQRPREAPPSVKDMTVVEVDGMSLDAGVNWTWDGAKFTNPSRPQIQAIEEVDSVR